MSHVSEFPLRPASSRRLLGPAVALFVAAAVVVVLSPVATNGPMPVPDRSAQGGASAAPYPHPRGVPPLYQNSRGEGGASAAPYPHPRGVPPLYQNSRGEDAAPARSR